MNCPYCDFKIEKLLASGPIPEVAPLICEFCGEIGILFRGVLMKATPEELEAIKQSPAYRDYLKPAQELIQKGVRPQ